MVNGTIDILYHTTGIRSGVECKYDDIRHQQWKSKIVDPASPSRRVAGDGECIIGEPRKSEHDRSTVRYSIWRIVVKHS